MSPRNLLCSAAMLLIALALVPEAPALTTVTIDSGTTYQTMTGWEATCFAMQESAAFPNFQDELFDSLVNDVGINRLRLEVRAGCENSEDNWTLWQTGQIDYDTWRSRRYSNVNDNADPNVIDRNGFHFSELDDTVEKIVLPIKQRVEANGEHLYINLNYVAFTGQIIPPLVYLHDDAQEYGEFMLATFQHLESRYGLIPDAVEIILEPDNVSQWDGTQVGLGLVAAGDRLTAAGFDPHFIAPSNTNMGNAVTYFDDLVQVPGTLQYIDEISYHRYGGVSLANLQAIASRAVTHGLDTSMLEWWFDNATYHILHEDITVGRNSAWQQYVVSGHFVIDDTDPANPTVDINSHSKYTRQYFIYVRAGALRIGATSNDGQFEPVAFINRDGLYVAVVKAATGDDLEFLGLPSGTYGISYTTGPTQWGIELPEQTIGAGDPLSVTMPAAGVITVYGTGMQWLLRNDEIDSLNPLNPALGSIFTGQGNAGLDLLGSDGIPQVGEGLVPEAPGSEDDDDAYINGFSSGDIDPDSAVCDDPLRPLVFYQISTPNTTLHIVKESPCTLRFFF